MKEENLLIFLLRVPKLDIVGLLFYTHERQKEKYCSKDLLIRRHYDIPDAVLNAFMFVVSFYYLHFITKESKTQSS